MQLYRNGEPRRDSPFGYFFLFLFLTMAKKELPKKPVKTAPIKQPAFTRQWWIMSAVVFLVSFIFYAGSITNEYALDDGITMEKNEYVHKGKDGIRDIMTKDAYESFFKQLGSKGQLSGGRYRPLSIITFAIEYDWFGFHPGDMITTTGTDGNTYKGKVKKIAPGGEVTYTTKEYGDGMAPFTKIHQFKKLAHIQHFNNVMLFALSMVVLFVFLSRVLLKDLDKAEYWALFVTLVFAMHPIHSEVVANIKSRDEILSLLFILLTLISFSKFFNSKHFVYGVLMMICFFLAMLSKEYAVVLLAIIPVWAFIKRKRKFDLLPALMSFGLLAGTFLLYYYELRLPAVMVADEGTKADVLNDYYMFAKGDEIKATQIYILLKYFLLQLYPYPLSSDYSFKTILYRHFSSPDVIFSLVLHIGMIAALIYAVIKKHLIFSFALMFYLFNLFLVSNLQFEIWGAKIGFNIGASMGERLVYNSSLGLIIIIFYILYLISKKIKNPKSYLLGAGVVGVLTIPFFVVTQGRNAAWKNDYTLATTDVKTNPNSALLNANACTYTVNKSEEFANKSKEIEMTKEAKKYCLKALEVHPAFANAWMSLALIEHKLKNFENEERAVRKVVEIFPNHPKIPLFWNLLSNDYIALGFEKYQAGKPDSCFIFLYKAKLIAPMNPEAYYNLGGAYLTVAKNADSAVYYFQKTLMIDLNHKGARDGYNSIAAINPQLPKLPN
jgi:hypothetical protein